jgi:hypothetical protein
MRLPSAIFFATSSVAAFLTDPHARTRGRPFALAAAERERAATASAAQGSAGSASAGSSSASAAGAAWTLLGGLPSALEAREMANSARPAALLRALRQAASLLPARAQWFAWRSAALELSPPSHARRFWPTYLALAAVGCLALHRCVANQVAVLRALRDVRRSMGNFLYEHIQEPLESISRNVFSAFFTPRSTMPTSATVAASQREMEEMLLGYGKEFASGIAASEGKSEAEFLAELPARARRRDMSFVMKKYVTDVESPALRFPSIARAILVQLQSLKVDGEEVGKRVFCGGGGGVCVCVSLGRRAFVCFRQCPRRCCFAAPFFLCPIYHCFTFASSSAAFFNL